MATRPVFIPQRRGRQFVRTEYLEFDWSPGFSVSQAQRSIEALHRSINTALGIEKILEISTKAPTRLGVALSAFNLKIQTVRQKREFSIESAYQGSKVFEYGGPYKDLLIATPKEAKRDPRLSSSGRLLGFKFLNTEWPLEPRTVFYDWLYVNALRKQPKLLKQVLDYEAFTDIAFNPQKSVSCQAYSAALCVSLYHRGLLTDELASKKTYLDISEHVVESAVSADDNHMSHLLFAFPTMTKASLGEAREKALSQLSDHEFPTWHSAATVKDLVVRWLPRPYRREEDFEKSLYKYLQRELPDVQIERKFSEGQVRADLAIADTVLVEVKRNLETKSAYQRLWEEIETWKDWDGELILLFTGTVDPVLVKTIEKKIKRWTPIAEPKLTIIKKHISKPQKETT